MRGFRHGSMLILKEKGVRSNVLSPIPSLNVKQFRGFLQGFVPTTARQAANSAVRFGSYTTLKQLAQSYVSPGEKLGAVATFGIGAIAGLITVYVTATHIPTPWQLTRGVKILYSTSRLHKDKVHPMDIKGKLIRRYKECNP